jgi:hypothetical protein
MSYSTCRIGPVSPFDFQGLGFRVFSPYCSVALARCPPPQLISETNRIRFVLLCMQNRRFGPSLAAINRTLISATLSLRWAEGSGREAPPGIGRTVPVSTPSGLCGCSSMAQPTHCTLVPQDLALFCMQNRRFGPYLAAINRTHSLRVGSAGPGPPGAAVPQAGRQAGGGDALQGPGHLRHAAAAGGAAGVRCCRPPRPQAATGVQAQADRQTGRPGRQENERTRETGRQTDGQTLQANWRRQLPAVGGDGVASDGRIDRRRQRGRQLSCSSSRGEQSASRTNGGMRGWMAAPWREHHQN